MAAIAGPPLDEVPEVELRIQNRCPVPFLPQQVRTHLLQLFHRQSHLGPGESATPLTMAVLGDHVEGDVHSNLFGQRDQIIDLIGNALLHTAIELIGNAGIPGLSEPDRFDEAIEEPTQAPDFVVPLRARRIEAQQHHVDVRQHLVHAFLQIPSRIEEQNRHSRFFLDEADDLPEVLSDERLPTGNRRADESLFLRFRVEALQVRERHVLPIVV